MTKAAADVNCQAINAVWRKANKKREGAPAGFQAALDNLHARRERLGCLKGCSDAADCPVVRSFAARLKEYRSMHERLTKCLEVGPCENKTIDDLQAALRTSARVLLSEIKPTDPLWTELISGFSIVVGFDTSAGSLLTMLSHLTAEQRQALDWKKLSRAIGAMLAVLPPNEMDAEDVMRLLDFAASVLGSDKGHAGKEALEKLRSEWTVVLGIMDKARSPAMRAAVDRMLDVLVKRYAADSAKAERYRNLRADLTVNASAESIAKVVRGLDIAELEEVQREAERKGLFPMILAEYRAKRLYTTVDLPAECPDENRLRSPECKPIYELADQFRLVLDGRALSGTTKTPSMDLDAWLRDLGKALNHDAGLSGVFAGQFAGGVGLQVRPSTHDSAKMSIRAAFIAEALDNDPTSSEPARFDRGEELRVADVAREPDVGKELAEAVIRRSTLLNAFDRGFYNTPTAAILHPGVSLTDLQQTAVIDAPVVLASAPGLRILGNCGGPFGDGLRKRLSTSYAADVGHLFEERAPERVPELRLGNTVTSGCKVALLVDDAQVYSIVASAPSERMSDAGDDVAKVVGQYYRDVRSSLGPPTNRWTALLFSGLPYLRDRSSTNDNTGWILSGADISLLMCSAGTGAAAVAARNEYADRHTNSLSTANRFLAASITCLTSLAVERFLSAVFYR
jgi:hypothetical protein